MCVSLVLLAVAHGKSIRPRCGSELPRNAVWRQGYMKPLPPLHLVSAALPELMLCVFYHCMVIGFNF
jgi:hypothetical protein